MPSPQGLNGHLLNCLSGDSRHRSGQCFPAPQERRADVKPVTKAILAGKARAHEVAAVVVELAQEQGAAFGSFCFPAARLGDEQFLDPVERCAVDDGFVLALKPLAAVVNLAEIDAVLEE